MISIYGSTSLSVLANLLHASNEVNASVLNLSGGVKANVGVADFAVGNVLAYQASAITTANLNAAQGKSLTSTAKSALDQIIALIKDQKNLATKALDDSLTDNDRANLNLQFQANVTEINRIATTTKFNNKAILDGSISGTADLTTATGQAVENYTLLSTSDYSLSGTTAAGNLTTSSVFNAVDTNNVGKVAGHAILDFGTVSGAVTAATLTIGADTVTFSSASGATAAATAFVAAANVAAANSSNTDVRKFTYLDNGNGTVTITAANKGTGANSTAFALTGRGGGIDADTTLFGSNNINTVAGGGTGTARSLTTASSKTLGSVRSVATDDVTIDANLQGKLTNFTATLDASGTNNTVTFTADINGKTYTSQAVTLFGNGGYNSKGNKITKNQDIVFYNSSGPTDGSSEFTDNAFKLTVGASDITVTGGDADAFQTNLTSIASGFETQLDGNHINQSRSLILPETNDTGSDFTIAAADGTLFEGIKGFDAVGTNAKGDINFVGDIFGTDGNNSSIGPFSFNIGTHKLTTTINGEVYTANLSNHAASLGALTTEGIAYGTGGDFNTSTHVLTVGSSGTVLVLHSASTDDGKVLQIDLSNVAAGDIDLSTEDNATTFTDDLNKVFGVDNNSSLTFQIGADSDNTLGFALNSAKTTSLYKDDAGAGKTLDISTTDGATQASDVLDNALNNAISLLSTTTAANSAFASAIVTNNVMINNFDAASSTLLNTDYAAESSAYAESVLKYNAGISVLTQESARLQSLLKLLSF